MPGAPWMSVSSTVPAGTSLQPSVSSVASPWLSQGCERERTEEEGA